MLDIKALTFHLSLFIFHNIKFVTNFDILNLEN
jgi:hypothetical protein